MGIASLVFEGLAREARLGEQLMGGTASLTRETAGLHTGLLIPGGFYVRGGVGDGITNAHPHWVFLSGDHFVAETATTRAQYRRITEGGVADEATGGHPATEVSWNQFDAYHQAHNEAHGTAIDFLSAAWHQRAVRGPVRDVRQDLAVAGLNPSDFPDWVRTRNHLENFVISGDGPEALRIINNPSDAALVTALTTGAQDVFGWFKHATVDGTSDRSKAWIDRGREGLTDADKLFPNAWGLNGMLGGVWELVKDWYDKDGYPTDLAILFDPIGPASGDYREALGGSWRYDFAKLLRAAFRGYVLPGDQFDGLGSRVGWRPRTQNG